MTMDFIPHTETARHQIPMHGCVGIDITAQELRSEKSFATFFLCKTFFHFYINYFVIIIIILVGNCVFFACSIWSVCVYELWFCFCFFSISIGLNRIFHSLFLLSCCCRYFLHAAQMLQSQEIMRNLH